MNVLLLGILAELGQNRLGRLRVEERDVEAVGSLARSLVDDADTLLLYLGQSVGHAVLDSERSSQ